MAGEQSARHSGQAKVKGDDAAYTRDHATGTTSDHATGTTSDYATGTDEPACSETAGGKPLASLGLRERKKRIRLQRILTAARALFMDKGFVATTIQDIAAAADVGLGTLYLYARSKEDLLVLVFKDDILSMIESSYQAIDPDAPLLEQFMIFFQSNIAYHNRHPELSRTVLKELSFSLAEQRREDIDQIMRVTYGKLSQMVEHAKQGQHMDKTLYTGTTAWSAFALYYHLLQGYLCGFHSEEEFVKSLRNALRALLA